jgi:hypothetical protein
MTPKAKAEYLLELFEYELIEQKKQYALKIVDEMLNEFYTHPIAKVYWQEVKNEINKL